MGGLNGAWLDVTSLEDGKSGKRRLRWFSDWPVAPPTRMIRESGGPACAKCGSTMMRRKWLLFGNRPGCIQPECENYGGYRRWVPYEKTKGAFDNFPDL